MIQTPTVGPLGLGNTARADILGGDVWGALKSQQHRYENDSNSYRELIINWIPVYVHFTCAYVYVRISYVLLDMCGAYVR